MQPEISERANQPSVTEKHKADEEKKRTFAFALCPDECSEIGGRRAMSTLIFSRLFFYHVPAVYFHRSA